MFRGLAIFSLLSVTPASGQDGPAFDCAKAESDAEKLVCADAGLAQLDRRVADRYAAALAVAKSLGAGAQQAEDALRAYQRGWVKGRDDCWKADDLKACVEAAYLRREGELVAQWLLEKPTSVAFWACDGNPANEVVTYFFDTTLPSVRFERGDAVDTGSLSPTGSGSKYEGSFGRSIWIKGDEATYREPDPDGTTMTCTLARTE
ncbi:MliC family protein [Defluviimonas sp. SAOS-178_SWC]|uniref:MliC family protein n=1 Tax=Defluviimonas sp. SAOS-178_SWC TaxID=3121287 RepID=UPI0032214A22